MLLTANVFYMVVHTITTFMGAIHVASLHTADAAEKCALTISLYKSAR